MAVANKVKHDEFVRRCGVAISSWAGGVWSVPFARRFHIDCRHLEDLELEEVFYGTSGATPYTWDRPLRDAHRLGRELLSLVKEPRHPELVLSSGETFEAFWRASSGRLQLQGTFARDGLQVHVWILRQLLTRCDAKLLLGEDVSAA